MILELIRVKGEISSKELAEMFRVSPMTINRDLNELEKDHPIQLIHGGAIYQEEIAMESPISVKELEHTAEKEQIGKYCRRIIKRNSSIFIETGTTTLAVAKEIFDQPNCTFFTNSLLVMNTLSKYEDINLQVTPGKYRDLSKGFLGIQTSEYVKQFTFDYCFVGTEGITLEQGVTLIDERDAFTKRAILKQSKCKILVTDSSKFNKQFLYKIGDVSDFDYIVTDQYIDDELYEEFNQYTKLIAAHEDI